MYAEGVGWLLIDFFVGVVVRDDVFASVFGGLFDLLAFLLCFISF